MNIKELLQKPYKEVGADLFVSTIIKPIFGEDNYSDGYSEPIINSNEELRKEAESIGIHSITKIGSVDIAFNQLDIYEIAVDDKVKMSRNRVGIQKIIRRIMDTYSSAFMIFYYSNDDSWEWRFSFCSKGKDDNDLTTAKRYTFLLGPGQSCRTASENFDKLLSKNGDIKIEDIQEAFDVEALSKEFFNKYKEHYERFVEYICDETNGMRASFINTNFVNIPRSTSISDKKQEEKPIRDYVKKMMGRIVFLHFLQKKGWLGCVSSWGDGDPNFMLNLFEYSSEIQKDNFLDMVLEPLFLAVDTDRSENDFKFDTLVKFKYGSIVKIPYLNGGLFERDSLDELDCKFPASYFKDFLKFLSEYNFTIDENDPNDAQIGVDPEMLGRIFENLLEGNKEKGAYYTPKVIVQYMCRESLHQYLENELKKLKVKCGKENNESLSLKLTKIIDNRQILRDLTEKYTLSEELKDQVIANFINNKLKEIKICDPAIGSGAFPLGLLNEIFQCRRALHEVIDPLSLFSNAAIKKEIIQNNIYGADLEKGAVDIARLRFWLALVVDETEPNALPNLDFKIMNGNSLIESFGGQDLSHFQLKKRDLTKKEYSLGLGLEEVDAPDDAEQIMSILSKRIGRYYSASEHNIKEQLSKEILSLVKKLLKVKICSTEHNSDILSKIDDIKRENSDFFLWHIFFSDVFLHGGFDIVIGNPPYIQLQKTIGQSLKIGDLYINENYKVFNKKGDIYCLFYEKGLSLLKDNGILCFITSNSWMRADYGKSLREFLCTESNPLTLIDFSGTKLFENAEVDVNILITSKQKNRNKINCLKFSQNALDNLSVIFQQQGLNCYFNQNGAPWIIMSPIEESIKRKIEVVGKPLKNWNIKINYGIKTGFNQAFIISTETKDKILSMCKTDDERIKTAEIIRPVLRGKDIKKYEYSWDDKWLICLFPSIHYDIDNFPTIKEYLLSFGIKRLEQTGKIYTFENGEKIKARKKTNNKWYEVQDSISYWEDFYKPKVIYPETTQGAFFSYDDQGYFLDKTAFMMTSDDISNLKYIQLLLSSKLFEYAFKQFYSGVVLKEKGYQYNKYTLENIPIGFFSQDIKNNIINSNTNDLDDYIYNIYGITNKEKDYIQSH